MKHKEALEKIRKELCNSAWHIDKGIVEIIDGALDESPSELPEDIEKWIEGEATGKALNDFPYNGSMEQFAKDAFCLGGKRTAQLLLPQLQQKDEEARDNKERFEHYCKLFAVLQSENQQQKETIEELKAKLDHYRIETSKVQQFVYDRKDIGLPCQPIFEAIKDFIDEQAAEIESLKAENEGNQWYQDQILSRRKNDSMKYLYEKVNYWKQRCEAAEALMLTVSSNGFFIWDEELKQKWESLKQQTHG